MLRSIRFLALAGTLLLAFGLFFVGLNASLICFDVCPPESDLAATIGGRIADAIPMALVCAVPAALAWILCLAALARAARWGALAVLALALPINAGLAWIALLVQTGGHPLPTTWFEHGASWDSDFAKALAVLLLWPLVTLAATFALPRRRAGPLLQPADG